MESNKKGNIIRSLVDLPVEGLNTSYKKVEQAITSIVSMATPKSAKSKRITQLSFDGFTPQGKNSLEKLTIIVKEFGRFLGKYTRRKTKKAISTSRIALVKGLGSFSLFKSWIVKKLIWSRGRLGRPIATAIITTAAFVVFMFGEVFNSSTLVNNQEINPDYLSSITDIIPRKSVALTTIPDIRKQSEAFTYIVESGDTLSGIGNKFKISTDALRYVNNLTATATLKVGQELVIPPVAGLIHEVKSGDTLDSIANKYNVPPQAIADFNYILDTSNLAVGTELVVPDAEVPAPVFVPTVPAFVPPTVGTDPNARSGWCIWPMPGGIVTQEFSWYHNGVDIAESWLPPIYACGDGVVTRAGWDPFGLGLHVIIDHGNGYETVYGHMSRLDVGFGQRISQGHVIGIMGSTGRSTGPHVHFIVKYNGVPQNPFNYIR